MHLVMQTGEQDSHLIQGKSHGHDFSGFYVAYFIPLPKSWTSKNSNIKTEKQYFIKIAKMDFAIGAMMTKMTIQYDHDHLLIKLNLLVHQLSLYDNWNCRNKVTKLVTLRDSIL